MSMRRSASSPTLSGVEEGLEVWVATRPLACKLPHVPEALQKGLLHDIGCECIVSRTVFVAVVCPLQRHFQRRSRVGDGSRRPSGFCALILAAVTLRSRTRV